MRPVLLSLLVPALLVSPQSHAGTACDVKSGATGTALVELYSSEGCSSCPPADQALSRLSELAGQGARFIPLALHVTYWDQIGWKDVFAQKRFDERQRALLRNKQNGVVYTPQFFVDGAEVRSWRGGLETAIRQTNSMPALVDLHLSTQNIGDGTVAVKVQAGTSGAQMPQDGDLYVALTESGLVSRVLGGENQGRELRHDHVVRSWLGPFPMVDGKAALTQTIRLDPGWKKERLNVVAFVQSHRNGNILQALSTAQCSRAGA